MFFGVEAVASGREAPPPTATVATAAVAFGAPGPVEGDFRASIFGSAVAAAAAGTGGFAPVSAAPPIGLGIL